MTEFPAKAGMGKRGRGWALVAKDGFSARHDLEMQSRGVVPAALLLNVVNPIRARGAALADFTMVPGFRTDITQAVLDGAMAEADPPRRRILPE